MKLDKYTPEMIWKARQLLQAGWDVPCDRGEDMLAAIEEAQARIAKLEAKNAALKIDVDEGTVQIDRLHDVVNVARRAVKFGPLTTFDGLLQCTYCSGRWAKNEQEAHGKGCLREALRNVIARVDTPGESQ